MKDRICITSGKKYIDIDAYAAIFAYKHLLENIGKNVYAYTTAIENESISKIIKDMNFQFDNIEIQESDKFIILDVSNPEFFDKNIILKNIIEIIDHHTGYEAYWLEQKEVNSHIEFIGSVCTIIFEKYIEFGKEDLLSENLCKLLIAGILDNTLNLKASITTDRDLKAYESLKKLGNIDDEWRYVYFKSCYENLEHNLKTYIENDIKIEDVSELLPSVFGQLIVLNKNVIFDNLDMIHDIFHSYENWILNIISLEDGKSYLFFDKQSTKNLEILFNQKSENGYIILEHFLLRKQVMKLARTFSLTKKEEI